VTGTLGKTNIDCANAREEINLERSLEKEAKKKKKKRPLWRQKAKRKQRLKLCRL